MHTFRQTDSDLNAIRAEVERAGIDALGQLERATYALVAGNRDAAATVVADDRRIDERQATIERACAAFIALRQPAASDLRVILAAVKVAAELERAGDEAKKIARMALRLAERADVRTRVVEALMLSGLERQVRDRLAAVLMAWARADVAGAHRLLAGRAARADVYVGKMRQLMSFMMEDAALVGPGLDLAWVIRALERIDEHIANAAEHVVYVVEGVDVRHIDGADAHPHAPDAAEDLTRA